MDPGRWERIQDIFDRAVERPAAERAAFVEREAGEDPLLAREVLSLLATWADDPDYLETGSEPLGVHGRSEMTGAPEANPEADPLIGSESLYRFDANVLQVFFSIWY